MALVLRRAVLRAPTRLRPSALAQQALRPRAVSVIGAGTALGIAFGCTSSRVACQTTTPGIARANACVVDNATDEGTDVVHAESSSTEDVPSGGASPETRSSTCVQSSAAAASSSPLGITRWLLRFLGGDVVYLLAGAFASVVGAWAKLRTPAAWGAVIDVLDQPDVFGSALYQLIGVYLLQNALTFMQQWLMGFGLDRLKDRLHSGIYEALLQRDARFFDFNAPTDLVGRLFRDVDQTRKFTETLFSGLLQATAGLVGGVCSLYGVSPAVTFKLMVASCPVGIYFGSLAAYLAVSHRREAEAQGWLQGCAIETLVNIRTVHSFTAEDVELVKFNGNRSWAMDSVRSLRRLQRLFQGSMMAVSNLVQVLIFHASSTAVMAGTMSRGEVNTLFQQTWNVLGSFAHLVGILQSLSSGFSASRGIIALLEEEPGIRSEIGVAPEGAVSGRISFKDVVFRYPKSPEKLALQGVSFEVPAGSFTAIVGGSGSGKTTVGWLLQRAYDAEAGAVQLDGHDVRQLQPRWLRGHIGYVEQEPRLFRGTVRENIRFGCASASDEEVQAAARDAQLEVCLETPVGDFGGALSGGQKQRVAIARAMLKDPRVLVLDEATSALDLESERLVLEALGRRMAGRTTLVIAHRLSTVRHADQIVVVADGRVVEVGAHRELSQRPDGAYARLMRQQGPLRVGTSLEPE